MSNFASEEYAHCKEWVAAKIQSGFTWEEVKNLCVAPDQVEAEFNNLRYIKSFIRNSRYFGLPQNRPRVYIMAFSKKMYGDAVKVLTEDLPMSGSKIIAEDLNAIIEPVVDDGYYMAQGYFGYSKTA